MKDVQHLYNPAEDKQLKSLNGRHRRVQRRMLASSGVEAFIMEVVAAIEELPASKPRRVAIGCLAGRHRSVALVEIIAKRLRAKGYRVKVIHRHLKRAMTGESLRRFL